MWGGRHFSAFFLGLRLTTIGEALISPYSCESVSILEGLSIHATRVQLTTA